MYKEGDIIERMKTTYTASEVLELIHDLVDDALCNCEGEYETENALLRIEHSALRRVLTNKKKEKVVAAAYIDET